MATSAARPEVGDILLVIHDFTARSSDELTLAKGDRVELVERDDEFGDGWFLGKHLVNGNSGLFPEVYTRPAPSTSNAVKPAPHVTATSSQPQQQPQPQPQPGPQPQAPPVQPVEAPTPVQVQSPPQPAAPAAEPAGAALSPPPELKAANSPVTLPLSSYSAPTSATIQSKSPPVSAGFSRFNQGQDNHVLHETLNVIDEHIDDLRSTPRHGSVSRHANDSGSEYSSSNIDHRLSYIAGEETDEEEDGAHSRSEVESWTPDEVAEYLFTSGVEKHHCEVFRDQEITGEVLLGMDQTSLFIKAFDLGSVGRRLKTWQKVKALQDEVNGLFSRPTTQTYGSEAGSDVGRRVRSRNNTITSISRLPPIDDRPMSQQKRRSVATTPKLEPAGMPGSPVSPRTLLDSPSRPNHEKRPSAASIRDLHHSRRHSSTDFRLPGTSLNSAGPTPKLMPSGSFPLQESAHKKQPSFDRNWTLGGAAAVPRPVSGSNFLSADSELQDSAVDLDRGYFSSAEGGSRNRNVLKKRDSTASHSRNTSYTEEQRVRSATTMARHSRFGSIGSIRGEPLSPAAQKYYGAPAANGNHRRTLSTNTTESLRPAVPSKDSPPAVTKLDTASADNLRPSPSLPVSPAHRQALANDLMQKPLKTSGVRAISDAITGQERAKIAPALDSPLRDSPMQSPSRTGSSTPSMGPSLELESPDVSKSPGTLATVGSRGSKKKGKKETSAYTRGLLKVSPRDAMVDADYSGWMKKKSNGLMTTWKPRLFVLKGRRLAYYYSEDDEQEKGLIDISFHRVLPADNERLTGLHATLTGASNSPAVPVNSNVQTIAATEADADPTAASDSIFIFKLVPPRAGLSRAVNFTKPTVHYFAVPNIKQGRLWMAALMKATIDRDDQQPIVTSYQQKTISLAKARQMRHRPPALMNLDEKMEAGEDESPDPSKSVDGGGLGIYNGNGNGEDSAVAGLEKLGLSKVESVGSRRAFPFIGNGEVSPANLPQSA
ncbi:hypothetical protein N8I77_002359 [Diaporthe amygdali]|uniref:Protein BOI2 n=1 Tax=Phomopsis amygdali TaxID=1214568 RepID=A0AAD9W970_PHOAM|nr:hypothetical protein N8I77_002359 [Diaporthe amygdali]